VLLHFKETGEGKPFVILHGLFGSADNWQTHANHLGTYFRVIAMDLRNHGHSPWDDQVTYQLMAEDVLETVHQLGIEHFMLLGHSMGGKVAMHMAQQHPQCIEKLIVVDMGIKSYPPHHRHILEAIRAVHPENMHSRGEAMHILKQHIESEGVLQFLLKNLYWKEKGKLAWRMNVDALEEHMHDILSALPDGDVYVPVLFIRGELSNYITDEDISDIESQFHDSDFATIPNAGHWVHAEAPEAFLHAVLSYCLR
jgi:esterase